MTQKDDCIYIDNLVILKRIGVPSEKGAHIVKKNTPTRRKKGDDAAYYNEQKQCWVAQYNLNIEGQRIRKSVSGKTEEEALQKLQAVKREVTISTPKKKAKCTFEAALDSMMNSIMGTVEDKTYCDYLYRTAILKSYPMAKKKLDTIDRILIQQTVTQMVQDHDMCKSTCQKIIMFIKRVFVFAVDNRDITYNPVASRNSIKVPKNAKAIKNILPLSSVDCKSVLEVLEQAPRIKPIVFCMLYAGLRLGEALALTWDAIDFNNDIVHVRHSVKRYNNDAGQKVKYYFKLGTTKTGSVRSVPMDTTLKQCLLRWRTEQNQYAKDRTGLNLVFPKRNGDIQSAESFNTGFRFYLQKNGLHPHTYHTRVFRHTYASYLVKENVAPKTLQGLLGHTDISTTLNHYVNVDVESQRDAAKKIDQVLGRINTFDFKNMPQHAG